MSENITSLKTDKTAEKILDRNGFDFKAFEYENEYLAKALLAAMEEHAKQEAILFSEWCGDNSIGYEEGVWFYKDTTGRYNFTTEEMHSLYLKSKEPNIPDDLPDSVGGGFKK
jgi:hypothetical protein